MKDDDGGKKQKRNPYVTRELWHVMLFKQISQWHEFSKHIKRLMK